MVLERMTAATLAGIDLQRELIMKEHSRAISREPVTIDGIDCIKLFESREGQRKLLCIAPAKYASIFLVGWSEELEIEKEG